MGSPKMKHVMSMENFQDYGCSVSFVFSFIRFVVFVLNVRGWHPCYFNDDLLFFL